MKPDDPELCSALDDPVSYCAGVKGRRRMIKSHLPLRFLPPAVLEKCKVIYVGRNPKDTAISFYHMALDSPILGYKGTVQQYLDLFMDGLNLFGPFFNHLLGGWRIKDHPNVKFLWFEDMKKDQKAAIRDLCDFLDHPLSEGQMDQLVDYINFENMKKNPNATPVAGVKLPETTPDFMRKGKVGDWKNHFNPDTLEKWDRWIEGNTVGTGIKFVDI